MDKFVIEGGVPLHGDVLVSGSKNAAVGILPAVLLADTPCTIENLPDIVDVRLMIEILEKIGVDCVWIDPETVRLDPRSVSSSSALYDVVSKLRGSYYLMGALLGRFGQMEVSLPGGCNLGARPIDQHLKGFQALGVDINTQFGAVKGVAKDESGKLIGANIYLDIASVGATINLMLASVKAVGQTVIENCAKEPHVVDVANFLNAMGANVRGAGTDIIKISGVPSLHGGISYSIIPDQIEAGTFMVAAAVTGGDVTVKNLIPRHQESLTAKLEEMNVGVEEGEDWIRIFKKG
ncbi:MAG: UDP-N-acetylglucosamine 1-carboxyvinyltransferase, partial [Clostridia bacterium]|nr:UDP-N-acetylglucosamine 1-carboxyvinyltransferase [Clostridia bacterium]